MDRESMMIIRAKPWALCLLLLLVLGYSWTPPTAAFSSSSIMSTRQSSTRQQRPPDLMILYQWNPFRRRDAFGSSDEEENDDDITADDSHDYDDSHHSSNNQDNDMDNDQRRDFTNPSPRSTSYDLGVGKNPPLRLSDTNANSPPSSSDTTTITTTPVYWNVPDPVAKPKTSATNNSPPSSQQQPQSETQSKRPLPRTTRRMVARDNDSQILRAALWDEQHYAPPDTDGSNDNNNNDNYHNSDDDMDPPQDSLYTIRDYNNEDHTTNDPAHSSWQDSQEHSSSSIMEQDNSSNIHNHNHNNPYTASSAVYDDNDALVRPPAVVYPDIDMSIPNSVYQDDGSIDYVWDLLRWEAYQEAQREPLLVSFLYSTILNHKSLESSLAFLLANRLASPAMMISTQLQSILLDTLYRDAHARRSLRADMMAVRDRDPACNCLPDVFLYFKGFHALQAHRVAHNLWMRDKHLLAHYLQSQVSQVFQIDIHPNATMGSGIMLDHGSGIVIGSTASVGNNCSILHHVTLGGSGKNGVVRHPQVQDGVLLGAGATVLGPVTLGEGSQVGAGTLVISDLPPHCVAVGVPARIIGSFVNVTEQPSVGMNQMIDGGVMSFESEGI